MITKNLASNIFQQEAYWTALIVLIKVKENEFFALFFFKITAKCSFLCLNLQENAPFQTFQTTNIFTERTNLDTHFGLLGLVHFLSLLG